MSQKPPATIRVTMISASHAATIGAKILGRSQTPMSGHDLDDSDDAHDDRPVHGVSDKSR
jgi:hypothetical protein